MRLCLFCGSNAGALSSYGDVATHVGSALAHRGIGLVYGGGSVGLMGLAADAALANGGEVIGVITEQLVRAEVAHRGLSSLEVVATMHERKARMADMADGCIVLPGGFGTLEEMAEMLTWNQLGLVAKPVVVLDVEGYWAPLLEWTASAVQAGFVRDSHRMLLQRAVTVDEAIALATSPVPVVGHKWMDRDSTPTAGTPRITAEIPRIPPTR
jgi:uncharacterized protein (TIGR00730 family)